MQPSFTKLTNQNMQTFSLQKQKLVCYPKVNQNLQCEVETPPLTDIFQFHLSSCGVLFSLLLWLHYETGNFEFVTKLLR